MSKMSNKVLVVTAMLLAIARAHAELPADSAARHTGVATCAASQCHGSTVPRDATGILQNEYVTWTQSDPHAQTFATLTSAQSQRIAARLGIGDASEARECLDCHADNIAPERRGDKFQLTDGVGCETCHGAAENWLATHHNAATQTHADNIAAGMYPSNEAAARAELCLSCHLGTDRKFAGHRMMAAGHPRLAFELDTFTELWRTAGRQPHYRVDADYRERKSVPSHSYTWATGLLADARQRLELIASSRFDGSGIFPELAFYDCHACHRSMKTVQWQRLPRHGLLDPGMPFINDGTFVMSLALARAIQPDLEAEIQDALRSLHVAASDSIAAIRAAAADLDALLLRLEPAVTAGRIRQYEAQILEAVLQTGASGNYIDYASAEQAFMAVQMLVIEIGDPALEALLDELADLLQDEERFRPAQFAALLNEFAAK